MKFKLRTWQPEDIDSLIKYADNFEIAKNLTNLFPHPYTIEDGIAFIERARGCQPTNVFAIDVNSEAVGAIGIHPQGDIFSKNAELGYWLGEAYWGNGIITKAIIEIVNYGFITFDINRIFARPFGTNIGSQKVLEKAGFTLEGKFEKTIFKNDVYLDELIYAIRK
jgi:RimJ/RimL family protein N-acetyltransferase